MQTGNFAGKFGVSWAGLWAGTLQPDPATQFEIAGGVLASTETLPMFGGIGIYEMVPQTGVKKSLGPVVGRATVLTNFSGFSVFDQNHAGFQTPNSPVPVVGSGMEVNFIRFGSNARIALAAAANLNVFSGGVASNEQVSWDFVGQQVVPYVAAYVAQAPTSASYVSSTGILTLNFSTSPVVGAGNWLGVSGYTLTAAQVNGSWKVLTYSSTVVTLQLPTGLTITSGDFAVGSPTTIAGGGALPISAIVDYEAGSSIIPVYNVMTGLTSWNYQGNAIVASL